MVERMIHPHESGKNRPPFKLRLDRLQRALWPRQGQGLRSIESRNAHRAIMFGNHRQRILFSQTNRQHGAISTRALMHQACPQHDYPCTFFKTQDARRTRRGNLSHTVPNNRRRLNPLRFPKLSQRQLHRKNRRLRNLSLLHPRIRLIPAKFFQK